MSTALWAGTDHEVDTADLTPRDAALATLWAATEGGPVWVGVVCESTRTMREMGGTDGEAALCGLDLDQPHRIVWDVPTTKPSGPLHKVGMAERFEAMARAIPLGYIPVEIGAARLADELREAATDELLTRDQLMELLRELGRPMTVQTIANYTSRPATALSGRPAPARYIGRTPVWRASEIHTFVTR